MHLKRVLSLSLIALAAASQAWIDTGHYVVARIAERDLKPAVRRKIEELLKVNGTGDTADIVGTAPWADNTRTRANGLWHYTNLHFRTDGKKTSNKPEAENVVWAIRHFSDIIKDQKAAKADKADALRYLIHFVADCHQPLHCVARDTDEHPDGDRGGNDFKLGESGIKPKPRNLHFLWDLGGGLLGRVEKPLTKNSYATIDKYASDFLKTYPATPAQIKNQNPDKWAQEGLALARPVVYNLQENTPVSAAYIAKCKEASGKRLVLAGKRLAVLLNSIVK